MCMNLFMKVFMWDNAYLILYLGEKGLQVWMNRCVMYILVKLKFHNLWGKCVIIWNTNKETSIYAHSLHQISLVMALVGRRVPTTPQPDSQGWLCRIFAQCPVFRSELGEIQQIQKKLRIHYVHMSKYCPCCGAQMANIIRICTSKNESSLRYMAIGDGRFKSIAMHN